MRRTLLVAAVAALVAGVAPGPARAQNGQERPAVNKAVGYLKSRVQELDVGEAALTALAMYKADVPVSDPAIAACMNTVFTCFTEEAYTPKMKGGPEVYEVTVVILAMTNIDAEGYKPQINMAAQYLISHQGKNGAWDYTNRTQGDTSMTQYALLGLWEAEGAGAEVPPQVWDNAASWLISVQASAGSWNYHRDEGMRDNISMTAAGVGSLMICQRQLMKHRKGQENVNPLMVPLTIDGKPANSRYKVTTPSVSVASAIEKGVDWIAKDFQVNSNEESGMGQSACYGLYGIERLSALYITPEMAKAGVIDNKDTKKVDALKGIDWYGRGLAFLLSKQGPDGAWDIKHGKVPNTCWAILFSVKSTVKSVNAILVRKLGGGTAKGSRFLPSDLNNVEVVGGELRAKPMGGAIEGMLAVLEDPNLDASDSAIAGLEAKYLIEGPKLLRPLKSRFRKLLRDPDPQKREIAVWGLGRTTDLDVAPMLIRALLDEDQVVVTKARIGLQILSRKLDGFGPEPGDAAEAREAAARRWLEWFNSVKPPDLDAPDDILPAAPKTDAVKTAGP